MPVLVPSVSLQRGLPWCCGAWWNLCSAGKLSGKSGSLAKALVICTDNCEDAPERRAAGGASNAVISNKS